VCCVLYDSGQSLRWWIVNTGVIDDSTRRLRCRFRASCRLVLGDTYRHFLLRCTHRFTDPLRPRLHSTILTSRLQNVRFCICIFELAFAKVCIFSAPAHTTDLQPTLHDALFCLHDLLFIACNLMFCLRVTTTQLNWPSLHEALFSLRLTRLCH